MADFGCNVFETFLIMNKHNLKKIECFYHEGISIPNFFFPGLLDFEISKKCNVKKVTTEVAGHYYSVHGSCIDQLQQDISIILNI